MRAHIQTPALTPPGALVHGGGQRGLGGRGWAGLIGAGQPGRDAGGAAAAAGVVPQQLPLLPPQVPASAVAEEAASWQVVAGLMF